MLIIGTFAIIHRGYLDILDKYQDAEIFILSDELAQELYKLEIDLRKMPQEKMLELLRALNHRVNILNQNNLAQVIQNKQIVLIDDDVIEQFKNKYLKSHPNLIIENGFFYHPIDQVYKTEKNINLVKNYTEEEKKFMQQALITAQESGCFWRQVGTIIIKDGQILYQDYNKMLPNKDECYKIGCIRDNFKPGEKTENCSVVHSEANCIAQAARDGISLKGATIYVTTFPCPACAKLIAVAGIKKCFYNTGWANFDGERVMQAAGVEITKIDL